MREFFSGGIKLTRCNPWGLALMGIAILLTVFSKRIAGKIRPDALPLIHDRIWLAALLLCAVGAMIAVCL